MSTKRESSKFVPRKVVISFATILHLIGIVVAFFEKKTTTPFNLNFHLLRLFT
jgi:hypothetical protein